MTATPAAKNKAELAIAKNFAEAAADLPGAGWAPAARTAALRAFAAAGLPHRRVEEWKYTDLRAMMKDAYPPAKAGGKRVEGRDIDRALGPALAAIECIRIVLVDGRLQAAPAEVERLSKAGVHFESLALAMGAPGFDWLRPQFEQERAGATDAVAALNAAFVTDGALLRMEAGTRVPLPVHLVFLSTAEVPASTTVRNLVEIGANASCVILESHVGVGNVPRQANAATEIRVGAEAHVQHLKLTAEGAGACHLSTCSATLGQGSTYRLFQMTAGTGLARNQTIATFAGEGARLDISGAFLARGAEHVDTTLVVDHAVGHCESRELFKGVLDGRARGIFQGKVIVRPDAQKTDGKQMAKALMLSPDAEFDAKPELEIYADDVVCGHGATAAELDSDLVFYCRSRGIPEAEARALLIESFIGEAIDTIEHPELRAALTATAGAWLAGLRT